MGGKRKDRDRRGRYRRGNARRRPDSAPYRPAFALGDAVREVGFAAVGESCRPDRFV